MRIVRADERYRSGFAGVESWHCFSAGGHYDADNVSHGALVGCDEHMVAPGAGFDWHGHRGVDIVSWVLAGELRHEDSRRSRLVRPGDVLWQATGDGVRHREMNASSSQPLRLVQMTLLASAGVAALTLASPPLRVGASAFEVWRTSASAAAPRWHVFVARGTWQLADVALSRGDSVRGGDRLSATGSGELLVWLL
jgi:mannose-6-phosphate isomerase-like protein (cupin superfamily)